MSDHLTSKKDTHWRETVRYEYENDENEEELPISIVGLHRQPSSVQASHADEIPSSSNATFPLVHFGPDPNDVQPPIPYPYPYHGQQPLPNPYPDGELQPISKTYHGQQTSNTARTICPLCTSPELRDLVVSTYCMHIFHRDCIIAYHPNYCPITLTMQHGARCGAPILALCALVVKPPPTSHVAGDDNDDEEEKEGDTVAEQPSAEHADFGQSDKIRCSTCGSRGGKDIQRFYGSSGLCGGCKSNFNRMVAKWRSRTEWNFVAPACNLNPTCTQWEPGKTEGFEAVPSKLFIRSLAYCCRWKYFLHCGLDPKLCYVGKGPNSRSSSVARRSPSKTRRSSATAPVRGEMPTELAKICSDFKSLNIGLRRGGNCTYSEAAPVFAKCTCGQCMGKPLFYNGEYLLFEVEADRTHHFCNWLMQENLHPVLDQYKPFCPDGRYTDSADIIKHFEDHSGYKEVTRAIKGVNYFVACKHLYGRHWEVFYGKYRAGERLHGRRTDLCIAGYGPYTEYDLERRYFHNEQYEKIRISRQTVAAEIPMEPLDFRIRVPFTFACICGEDRRWETRNGAHLLTNWMILNGLLQSFPVKLKQTTYRKGVTDYSLARYCKAGRMTNAADVIKHVFKLLGLHPTQQPPADGKNCFIFCRNSKEPLRFRAIYYGNNECCVAGTGVWPEMDYREYWIRDT